MNSSDNYIKVCNISELKDKKGSKFFIDDDTEIAVFKVKEKYYAVSNICPHNHSPVICDGFIDPENYVICPVHCYRFHLETGEVPLENKDMSGKLEIFNTKIINNELWIEKRKKKKIFFNWSKILAIIYYICII